MESAAALVSFSLLNFNIKPSYAIANPSFPSHSSKITPLHQTLQPNCSYPSSSSNTIFRSLSAPLSPISLRNPFGRASAFADGETASNSPSAAIVLNVEVSIILGLLFVYSLFSLLLRRHPTPTTPPPPDENQVKSFVVCNHERWGWWKDFNDTFGMHKISNPSHHTDPLQS